MVQALSARFIHCRHQLVALGSPQHAVVRARTVTRDHALADCAARSYRNPQRGSSTMIKRRLTALCAQAHVGHIFTGGFPADAAASVFSDMTCLNQRLTVERKSSDAASPAEEALFSATGAACVMRAYRIPSRRNAILDASKPCSAALRCHLTASFRSLATPSPFSYIMPRLYCAMRPPCMAALWNHRNAVA